MKTPIIVLSVLLMASAPIAIVRAQADPQLNAIDRSLSGRRFLVSYREGGAAYGTHVSLEIHYCANGEYILFGRSQRQTVLDNWQVNNWQDAGRWNVVRVQGQTGVRAVSVSGKVDFVAVETLPGGRLWAGEGVSVQAQGPARCR